MSPGPDDELLRALLRARKLGEVQISYLRSQRVVPAGDVVHRNVLVLLEVIDDAGTHVFPEVVIVAMAHSLQQPEFVVGSKLQWCRAGPQRQHAYILQNLRTEVLERAFCSRYR